MGYTFAFSYNDGPAIFDGVIRAEYISHGESYTIEGEDILTHSFPIANSYHLLAPGKNFTVSGEGLCSISIEEDE